MSKELHYKEEGCFIRCRLKVFLDLFSKNIVTREEYYFVIANNFILLHTVHINRVSKNRFFGVSIIIVIIK